MTDEVGLTYITAGMWIKYVENQVVLGLNILEVEQSEETPEVYTYRYNYRLPADSGSINRNTIIHSFTGTQEDFINFRLLGDGELEVAQVFMEVEAYESILRNIAESLSLREVYQAAAAFYLVDPLRLNSSLFWRADEFSEDGVSEQVDVIFGLYPGEWRYLISQIG